MASRLIGLKKRCGARKRGTQILCKRWAMPNGRCALHGGKTPAGIASVHFKTGRYARDLPVRLAASYLAARNDPEIHSLNDEIGVAQARLQELFRRLETSDLGHAWISLAATWALFVKYRSAGDVPAMTETLAEFETIVQRGQQDYLLWQEIGGTIKLLSSLRVSEHKRLVDLQTMMSALDAERLWGVTQHIVRDAILAYADTDVARRILTRIQAELARYDLDKDRVAHARLVGTHSSAD